MRWIACLIVILLGSSLSAQEPQGDRAWIWRDGRPQAKIVPPQLHGRYSALIDVTINGYLADSYRWSLSSTPKVDEPLTYIVVGDETNNPVLRQLVDAGLKLQRDTLGDEGYRIVTHEADSKRYVIVTANTPIGLKHGCQELIYFHLPVTTKGASVDWPMDLSRTPAVDYRGIYILPCWAAYDSESHYKKVVNFCSELTLNRVWFWVNGFPLLEQYGGEYKNTPLANAYNVNGLIWFSRSRGMKFYLGGGWFTWHHEKIAQGSIARGIQYYRDLLALLPEAEGIYLEPAGEGKDVDENVWRERTDALSMLTDLIWRDRPEMEFAVATGEFNNDAYRKQLHKIDDKRIYWWWCWGDPIRDKALEQHPLVLRWHTNVEMSDYHGSTQPPEPGEAALTGVVTSYDPGQGFGNPWNGSGKMGVEKPREFDPHELPYFSNEYWYRERCWDLDIDDKAFATRMQRRLFDADYPEEAIAHYLKLASMCAAPTKVDDAGLKPIEQFVKTYEGKGTQRTQDTLKRMRTAIDGIRKHRNNS